jgi:hypothetical protein
MRFTAVTGLRPFSRSSATTAQLCAFYRRVCLFYAGNKGADRVCQRLQFGTKRVVAEGAVFGWCGRGGNTWSEAGVDGKGVKQNDEWRKSHGQLNRLSSAQLLKFASGLW